MKKVFISQSNYIPWRGYFDAINAVDEFVIYDDVQYTKNDWRNRNKIKTSNGVVWLTIPAESKNGHLQKIKDVKISNANWQLKHWKSIQLNYARAPYFKDYAPIFEEIYCSKKFTYLVEVNYCFIELICKLLDIKTTIKNVLDFNLKEKNKTERLIELCQKIGGTDYYSGPSAKNYLDEIKMKAENIQLHYINYSNYLPYEQQYGDFIEGLSVLDLIFNEGSNSKHFLKSFSNSNELILLN